MGKKVLILAAVAVAGIVAYKLITANAAASAAVAQTNNQQTAPLDNLASTIGDLGTLGSFFS